jgi:hypothetical protein
MAKAKKTKQVVHARPPEHEHASCKALGQVLDRIGDKWTVMVVGGLSNSERPLDVSNLTSPIIVIPLRRLDLVGQKALRFALTISPSVCVVQIRAEELDTENLEALWKARVEEPVRQRLNIEPPRLVLIQSPYRQFFERLLAWLHELSALHPDRQIIVLIPELVHRRWFQFILSHRALRLKAQLLLKGGPHVSVMSTPWYPDLGPSEAFDGRTARVPRT